MIADHFKVTMIDYNVTDLAVILCKCHGIKKNENNISFKTMESKRL